MKGLQFWKSYEHTEDSQLEKKPDILRPCVCICVYRRPVGGNTNLLKEPSYSRVKGLFSPAPKSRIVIKEQIQVQYRKELLI